MNTNPREKWPTPEQIAILRDSMVRLIPACEDVSDNFYRKLFESHPQLRPLFAEDMEPQKEKLILMLATAIDLLGDREGFEEACAEHGRRHVKYGALPAHYPIVAQLTLSEIGAAANPPLNEDEQEAWTLLLDLVVSHMLNGIPSASNDLPQG